MDFWDHCVCYYQKRIPKTFHPTLSERERLMLVCKIIVYIKHTYFLARSKHAVVRFVDQLELGKLKLQIVVLMNY